MVLRVSLWIERLFGTGQEAFEQGVEAVIIVLVLFDEILAKRDSRVPGATFFEFFKGGYELEGKFFVGDTD